MLFILRLFRGMCTFTDILKVVLIHQNLSERINILTLSLTKVLDLSVEKNLRACV